MPVHNLSGNYKILVLTTFEDDDLIVSALRAGASGFLGMGVSPADLSHAIRTIADGGQLLSPAAARALIQHLLAQPD